MLLNVSCNHSWSTVSWRRNVSKEIKKKVTAARSLPLCPSPVSLKKKNNKKGDNSCTFPERERRVSFTKPDGDLP